MIYDQVLNLRVEWSDIRRSNKLIPLITREEEGRYQRLVKRRGR